MSKNAPSNISFLLKKNSETETWKFTFSFNLIISYSADRHITILMLETQA